MLAAAIVLVALAGGAGFYAYQTFFPSPEAAPPPPRATPPQASNGSDRTPASSMPGKMIEKAKAAAAARDQVTEEQLGAVLDSENQKTPPADTVTAVQSEAVPDAPAPSEPARLEPVAPSEEFKQWVARVRVSGVRGGAEARAHLNDRLVRKGEVVDHGLGITFEGVDPAQNVLLFKDRDGAVVGKRF